MIYLECDADKALVSVLGISKNEIRHVHGKGNVCNRLERNRDCIGLIDEDPGSSQPSYLQRLQASPRPNDIVLFHDKRANNRVVMLRPWLEEWILKTAREAAADLSKYGLPHHAGGLHEIINIRMDHFKRFVEELKATSQRLKALAEILRA